MIEAGTACDIALSAADRRRSMPGRDLVDGYSGGRRVTHTATAAPADPFEDDRESNDDGDEDDHDAVLHRVLSDVRRAYCRQPVSGTSVDNSNVTDGQSLSTEFIKQLSDYSDADRTAISTSSMSPSTSTSPESTSSRPHISRSTSMVAGSFGTVSWRERGLSSKGPSSTTTTTSERQPVNQATVGGGSGVRVGGGRGTRENRVSLRPRRALSLDRPVSLPPFLRPIEEEDTTSTGPDVRTPTETMFGDQMTSPPSSPASSSSSTTDDDDDDMPTNTGNGSHQRIIHHRRRHHYHVEANKLYGKDRWLDMCSPIESEFDTKTTEKLSTNGWEPDYSASCFDSDEECRCTSSVRSASAASATGRRPRFQRRVAPSVPRSRDSCQLSIPCQYSSQSGDVLSTRAPAPAPTTSTDSGDATVRLTATSPPEGITVTSGSVTEVVTSAIDVTLFHDAGGQRSANARDATSPTSRSEVSSHVMSPSSSSRIHFYVLMTSVAVFTACLTSASPICLAALVALTSFATYPIAKF